MSDLKDALDQIKARAEKATEGPWETGGSSVSGARESWDLGSGPSRIAIMQMPHRKERMESNAAFIAAARTDIPRLVSAIEAVLEKAGYMTRYAHGQDYWGGVRAASQEILAALNDKLTGEDDD